MYRDQSPKLSPDTEDSVQCFDDFLARRGSKKLAAVAKEISSVRNKRAKN